MDNMTKIEQGAAPAGPAEGGQSRLGATQAENAGFGEARDLGPGEVEKMFGPAKTPLDRLREAGRVEETPAEMGGGGDAIDDWVVKKGGYDGLLRQIQQNGWADNMVWPLGDGTKLSVAEVRRRAAAAVTPPPPEPQKVVDPDVELQKQWISLIADSSVSADRLRELKVALLRAKVQPKVQWDPEIKRFAQQGSHIENLRLALEAEIVRRREKSRPIHVSAVQTSVGDWREVLTDSQKEILSIFEQRMTNTDLAALAQLAQEIVSFQATYVKTGKWPVDAWVDRENAPNFLRSLKNRLGGESNNDNLRENRLMRTTGINRF